MSSSPVTAATAVTVLIALATMLAQTMPSTSASDGTQEIRAAITLISESALAALALNDAPPNAAIHAARESPSPRMLPPTPAHDPVLFQPRAQACARPSPKPKRSIVPSRSSLGEYRGMPARQPGDNAVRLPKS